MLFDQLPADNLYMPLFLEMKHKNII